MDGELDMCGLCWVCWPVWAPASRLVSPVVVGQLRGVQSLLPGKGGGNLVGSVPGHHGMGGRIHPSESVDEIQKILF